LSVQRDFETLSINTPETIEPITNNDCPKQQSNKNKSVTINPEVIMNELGFNLSSVRKKTEPIISQVLPQTIQVPVQVSYLNHF